MRIKQISTPVNLPLTLAEAKRQLRIEESETAFDDDITSLIKAAAEWIYATCHVTLITTEYRACFDSFPNTRQFKIPGFPLDQIIVITYRDPSGAAVSAADYQLDKTQVPAAIYPAPGEEWPETQSERIDAVRIDYEAGYGASATNVPELPKHLLRLLVAHWFKNREAVVTGAATKEIEIAADNLMKLIRVNEFESFAV